ncbi:DUF2290 domain-containing protein [Nocardia huaxiensis]|uniref:DUF2290 domain-containing protein n=1 Tax=Nocardia huaxiensis TaxID=2755382 RepID=A0A7D6VDQ8_9NOCA|nr:DUF2290 domain-containing protein [Nocardia huaxiensis]QLY30417.1 DUF2290 domain-containing protein [Nocardia huaxiensis]
MSITRHLTTKGLVNDQNFPRICSLPDQVEKVDYPTILPGASLLRDVPYRDMYTTQLAARSYNFLMLDGAIVQMVYQFRSRRLLSSRLAFLPSPDLSEYQNDPELYSLDLMFAEVVDRRVVTVPMRFDFDSDDAVVQDLHHPKSHLTLGQYSNCRIAATSAITPGAFVEFILRSFYNTASREYASELPTANHRFEPTITPLEASRVHIGVPK